MSASPCVVIFGASGAIGTALISWFADRDWNVFAVSRSQSSIPRTSPRVAWISWDPVRDVCIPSLPPTVQAVVWAQGENANDSVETFNISTHLSMYEANVIYILRTLRLLLDNGQLNQPSRLCVISSIWQNIARQNKLSYCVTKAALQGLVLSASVDLAKYGHTINAVLPGALDTPMTRANLSSEQVHALEKATFFNRLPNVEQVCAAVGFCCSPDNTGITGQFIAVDQGFSHARII